MTSQEYADMITAGNAPWMEGKHISQWSDSTKEQYFNFLNAELANQMEIDRWRLNNEYNTPVEQMKRMIAAGINPAAAYQNISTGNSSQAPDTHQPGTAAFHDTQDKLARINTIMNGISSIMSTIEHGVGAVSGIQDIGINYQNHALDHLRYRTLYPYGYNLFGDSSLSLAGSMFGNSEDAKHFSDPIEVAPGFYMEGLYASLFPDLVPQNGFAGGKYHQAESSLDIQSQLADRRTRIDNLIQDIMNGLENNASNETMLKYFMQLFMYGAMSKFGGF